MLKFEIRNTRTGALELPIEVASCEWKAQIAPGSTVSPVMQCRDTETEIDESLLHALTEPTGEFSVSVSENGSAIAAGVIVDAVADDDAGTMTLQCADINDVFWNNRLGSSVQFITTSGINIVNKSASGFVREVIWRALDELHPDFPRWHLPVDLPADGSGTWSKEFNWWDFKVMGDLLQLVRDSGYSIHHKPYITSGNLRYSTTVARTIVNDVVPLTHGSTNSLVSGLKYQRNGQELASGVLRIGNGEGEDTLTRFGVATEISAPIRHIINTDAKSVDSGAWLQRAADTDVEDNGVPQVAWALNVHRSDEFGIADFAPGNAIHLDVRDHWVIPDGIHKLRIVSLSGDALGDMATPEVVPYA